MAPSREGIVNVALAGIGTATKVALDVGATALGAGPFVSVLSAGAEALAGYQMNRLASRADRADARRAASEQLLANEHVTRAVARAIQLQLTAVAGRRLDATAIVRIADRAEEWWPALVSAGVDATRSLDDRALTHRIAEHLTGRVTKAPSANDWRSVLDTAASFIGDIEEIPGPLLDEASESLERHFVAETITVLKGDAATSGAAFARVLLQFLAEIWRGYSGRRRRDETRTGSSARHRELVTAGGFAPLPKPAQGPWCQPPAACCLLLFAHIRVADLARR